MHRRPSDEHTELPFAVVARIELGPRLIIVGHPDMAVLGTAVHAVLAADVTTWGRDERLARASAILTRWGVHEIMPRSVIDAADRLNDQLRTMWPAAHIRREVPIHAHLGAQLVRGRIDLLVEDSDGFAVIDHKSFPGSRDRWESHAVAHGPQLRDYAQAIVLATGKPCRQLYVHLPIVGALLEVAPRPLA